MATLTRIAEFGKRLYRLELLRGAHLQAILELTGETVGVAQGIKMLGTAIGQRSTMIANKGIYYIDTTMSPAKQGAKKSNMNVFWAGEKYNFFLIYAKPTTKVTFQLYVGKSPQATTFD